MRYTGVKLSDAQWYDLRKQNVRQLEYFRGFIEGLGYSRESETLLQNIADEAGITNPVQDLDKDRHKLKLNGTFDPLIALVGSITRILKRARCDLNLQQFAFLQWDALKTIIHALIDCKATEGDTTDEVSNAFKKFITVTSTFGAEKKTTALKVDTMGKLHSTPVLDAAFFSNKYTDFVKPAVEKVEGRMNGSSERPPSELSKLSKTVSCLKWNTYLQGAKHVSECTETNETHKKRFHKCTICAARHKMVNCPYLRKMMKLIPYDSRQNEPRQDTKLPRGVSGGGYSYGGGNNNYNNYYQQRGGGRGRGRGRGGRYRNNRGNGRGRGDYPHGNQNQNNNVKNENKDKEQPR